MTVITTAFQLIQLIPAAESKVSAFCLELHQVRISFELLKKCFTRIITTLIISDYLQLLEDHKLSLLDTS